ncbi:MAG: DNRLRE domain-containing protein [candidate division Zixibacteria bacterium]|nr:DNRLRE domain-containing protein [candidate division Zixibacteria bacterium]
MQNHRFATVTVVAALSLLVVASVATAAKLTVDILSITPVLNAERGGSSQALLKFDVPEQLQGARIDLAEICVEVDGGADSTRPLGVMISPVMQDWDVTPAGLISQDISHNDTLGVAFFLRNESYSQRADLNITEVLQSWIDGEATNKGFLIKAMGATNARMELATPWFLPGGLMAQVKVHYTAPEKPVPERR